ncbi:MAG: efflux RND transporter periplasmic adaptor subunit, partial [Gemmatimonadota bacterium]
MKSASRSLLPLLLLGACAKPPALPVYQAVAAQKRDITVTAQASGAINADTVVQVKSKASGEILDVKVQTGDVVRRGTLMIQVDQRIPANQVATAKAALQVDSAQLSNAKAQLKRQQELFAARAVTQQELEAAQLAVAQANAAVVRDGINLDDAKIAMGDTEVRAPITGTIIEQAVQRGTVISSPTNSASGGTALLTMADLSNVQVKTWVDETDIGKLHPGMEANVTVAAFANRPFKGVVAKIEPQADTIQNVTMFPVLVNIDNKDGLLKPGMNADVKMAVGSRTGVLAIPNAALRTEKDVASAASVLGISSADLTQMLADAKKVMADAVAQKADTSAGVPLPNPAGGNGAGGQQGRGGAGGAAATGGDSTRRGRRNNGGDSAGAGNAGGGGRGRRNGGDSASGGNGGGRQGGGNAGGGGMGRGNAGGAGGADAAAGMGGGGGGRGGRGGRGGGGKSDYMFGGRYIVFTMKAG